jgi:hypothetical protein
MFRFIMLIPLAATLLFSACSKCTTCSPAQGSDVKFCESDYSSASAYNDAINMYEGTGYSCSASGF